ncbi:hypothetical protein [Pseudomonas glycinae]|uniref:hypothetical protein n=1 Tax=Pseudomonas glycinae TaxID=1785145 RepID=UPI00167E98FB|nr:hypothetical protein [Pseudomonas glycinae]
MPTCALNWPWATRSRWSGSPQWTLFLDSDALQRYLSSLARSAYAAVASLVGGQLA